MKAKPFEKVCVIGAGVMGSGIAAHLANAGVPVLLLDIVPPKHGDKDPPKDSRAFRDRFAAGGKKTALKLKPAPLFTKDRADLI